tara:strand:+ start:160 stop:729 length:570 start_codon:yes stop_codon:yes gene_type:complete
MYAPSLDDVLLEPFSVFIKLAIVSFKETGTKISVGDNTIYIENPGMLQGIKRFISRSNREHISYLSKPIKRVLVMYPPENENLQYIYGRVIKGIGLLKLSYHHKSSTILHSLDLYIHLINKSLIKHKEPDDIHIPEKLIDLWKPDDIHILCLLFKDCESTDGDINYINSIECILKSKESAINNAISQII